MCYDNLDGSCRGGLPWQDMQATKDLQARLRETETDLSFAMAKLIATEFILDELREKADILVSVLEVGSPQDLQIAVNDVRERIERLEPSFNIEDIEQSTEQEKTNEHNRGI